MRKIGERRKLGGRRDVDRFDVFRKNDARKRTRPFEIGRVSIYLIKRAANGKRFRRRRAFERDAFSGVERGVEIDGR